MTRRLAPAAFAVCMVLVFESCMLYDNGDTRETRQCVAKSTVKDGDACHCDTDCTSFDHDGFCFAEAEFGYPRGYCFHECKRDRDCGEGLACVLDECQPKCSWSYDCDRGRLCMTAGREGVPVCMPHCDEAADCESGRCNLYSGDCLTRGAKVAGRGLNAECEENEDCRSERCRDGRCVTLCDPLYKHCPDGAVCTKDGLCVDPSDVAPSCGPDASVSDEADAGAICEAGDPTE